MRLDDLTEMNVANTITAYNRVIVAARHFFRDLTTQPRFKALGLKPPIGVNYKMSTDGTSRGLNQPQDWFELSTLAYSFRKDS